nr:MAG TPA: hypothetical protein [Caudoviricetes sp.]
MVRISTMPFSGRLSRQSRNCSDFSRKPLTPMKRFAR